MAKIKVFHLQGGIDYKKMGPIHKGMMTMLKNMILKKDQSELSEEDRSLLEIYGDKVDFLDKNSMEPIITFVKGAIVL